MFGYNCNIKEKSWFGRLSGFAAQRRAGFAAQRRAGFAAQRRAGFAAQRGEQRQIQQNSTGARRSGDRGQKDSANQQMSGHQPQREKETSRKAQSAKLASYTVICAFWRSKSKENAQYLIDPLR